MFAIIRKQASPLDRYKPSLLLPKSPMANCITSLAKYLDELSRRHDPHDPRVEAVGAEDDLRQLLLGDDDRHGLVESRQERLEVVARAAGGERGQLGEAQ